MKIKGLNAIIAFGISVLLGFLCYEFVKTDEYGNWISLVVASISIFICLGSAIACDYNSGYRNVNIKVSAWVFTLLVVIANFMFCCFEYNIVVYVVVVAILTLIDIALVNALYKPQEK